MIKMEKKVHLKFIKKKEPRDSPNGFSGQRVKGKGPRKKVEIREEHLAKCRKREPEDTIKLAHELSGESGGFRANSREDEKAQAMRHTKVKRVWEQ